MKPQNFKLREIKYSNNFFKHLLGKPIKKRILIACYHIKFNKIYNSQIFIIFFLLKLIDKDEIMILNFFLSKKKKNHEKVLQTL